MRGNIPGYHTSGTNHGALPDLEGSPAAGGDNDMRADKRAFSNNYLAGAASMGDQDGSNANLDVVADLDALRVFVINKNIIANENIGTDLYTPGTMKSRSNRGRARTEPCHHMEETIANPSEEPFIQRLVGRKKAPKPLFSDGRRRRGFARNQSSRE
jgi:hypothetical protein